MKRTKTRWLLAGVLCLLLWPVSTAAQETAWEKYMGAAATAYQQGDYAEAEKQFKIALKEAEQFGDQDPRLGMSLLALGSVYIYQGLYAQAEPLIKRSLAIGEKALGPEHLQVAASLNSLAKLHQEQGADGQAEPLVQEVTGDRGEGCGTGASRRGHEPQQLGGALPLPR